MPSTWQNNKVILFLHTILWKTSENLYDTQTYFSHISRWQHRIFVIVSLDCSSVFCYANSGIKHTFSVMIISLRVFFFIRCVIALTRKTWYNFTEQNYDSNNEDCTNRSFTDNGLFFFYGFLLCVRLRFSLR